jgi:hypothetical protein
MLGDNLGLKQKHRFRRQAAWLIALAALAAAAAVALPLTPGRIPVLASYFAIAAVALTLWFAGANPIGTILWVSAAAILCAGVWTRVSYHGLVMFPISSAYTAGGILLSMPAVTLFVLALIKNQSRCAGNCAGCMVVLFTFVIYGTSRDTMYSYRDWPETVQETRTLISTLHQLTAEIEELRSQLGRLPRDEAELVALRGKPMPPYYKEYRIGYRQYGGSHKLNGDYRLDCGASHFWGRNWDFFPWIFEFYGPDAVQRLQAISF